MKAYTERWVVVATEDLEVAELVLGNRFHSQTVYHCQQALEKLLKAIWIERHEDGTHPYIHNLVKLATGLDLGLSQDELEFLQRLSLQYTPTRYAGENDYSAEAAQEYFEKTRELFGWLRQQLT